MSISPIIQSIVPLVIEGVTYKYCELPAEFIKSILLSSSLGALNRYLQEKEISFLDNNLLNELLASSIHLFACKRLGYLENQLIGKINISTSITALCLAALQALAKKYECRFHSIVPIVIMGGIDKYFELPANMIKCKLLGASLFAGFKIYLEKKKVPYKDKKTLIGPFLASSIHLFACKRLGYLEDQLISKIIYASTIQFVCNFAFHWLTENYNNWLTQNNKKKIS